MNHSDDCCATFSKDADRYVPSEGAVSIIVKSCRAALRDGNHILGIICAPSVHNTGRSQGLAVPGSRARAVLRFFDLAESGFKPKATEFVRSRFKIVPKLTSSAIALWRTIGPALFRAIVSLFSVS